MSLDYEKILKSLKICSDTGTSCEGCSGMGERHCIANLTKAAAIAIETLLHTLDMAQRERDVVTKRMIELEQETVTNRNGLNEPLTLDELRKMYDGEEGAVWVKNGKSCFPAILDIYDGELVAVWSAEPDYFEERHYGKTWLAYRQKPEEGAV